MTQAAENANAVLAALTDEDRQAVLAGYGIKRATGLAGLLSDPKLPISFIVWIVCSISAWQMIRQSPDAETKIQYFQIWGYASAGIWSAIMVAMGYQRGKSNEGTVPEGHIAIPNVLISPAKMSETVVPEVVALRNSGGAGKVPFFFLPFLLLFANGCAGTSGIYKEAISRGLPQAIAEVREYNAGNDWDADKSGTIDASEESARFAEAAEIDALAATIAIKKAITLAEVMAKWGIIAPRYRYYINNDAKEPGADDKLLRLGLPNEVDEINRRELERQDAVKKWYLPAASK